MASSEVLERLNLVLCGSGGEVKMSTANFVFGKKSTTSSLLMNNSSSVCVKREGKVCGHWITLVEMPALYNTQLSEKEMLKQALHCVSLCDPGVHAFFLIIPDGSLNEKDTGEIENIQTAFGSRFNNHTHVLITPQSQIQKETDEATKKAIAIGKGAPFILKQSSQASDLIAFVKKHVAENNFELYTTNTFLNAQVEKVLKYQNEIKKLKETVHGLQAKINVTIPDPSAEMRGLRVVLLGKTGVGKSATGNTILRRKDFRDLLSPQSVTSMCQKESAEVKGRLISVIDTPGLFDTGVPNEEISREIAKCITMAAPGPHVFLLVLALGRFTKEEEEAVKMIQDLFGDESRRYTIVLFTKGDELEKMEMSIEDFIKDSERSLQNLLHQCGNRYHVFNNSLNNHSQVTDLLEKIDSMVAVNGGSCYTNEMFRQTEKALKEEQERILKEREEEIEREKEELKMKHEAEIENMKKSIEGQRQELEQERNIREKEFKEREEQIKREFAEREQSEREHYNRRMEEDEERMKVLKAEINREREENRKRWEKQREEDQRQREQEEEERRKKEEEWRKKQREEREKFEKEKDEMIQKQKADQQKVQQEYEQKAAEEEKRRTELEEKIKHAEESKKKELRQLQLSQQREWRRKKQEEEKRRKEEESKWKERMEFKEKEWQIQEHKKKEQHEQERKTEMERRVLEENKRKQKEEEEKKNIEHEANEKIRQMMEQLEAQREKEEKRREKIYEQHRKEMKEQQADFRKEKEETEKKLKEEEQRKLAFLEDIHLKQMENLKRETKLKARKQAEEEFCAKLDTRVEEARKEAFKEGCAKVESQRTDPGRFLDMFIKLYLRNK